jgi:hypothetical protein
MAPQGVTVVTEVGHETGSITWETGDAPGWPTHLRVHDYDEQEHGPFLRSTFAHSLRRPPRDLMAALEHPGSLALVATPVLDPKLVGWLAARPADNRIICCYTGFVYRASVDQRQGKPGSEDFRIASSLAIAAGIDFSRPVPCSFWSRAAKKIAAKPGNPYGLVFSPERP